MNSSEQNQGGRQQQKGLKQHRIATTTMTTDENQANDDDCHSIGKIHSTTPGSISAARTASDAPLESNPLRRRVGSGHRPFDDRVPGFCLWTIVDHAQPPVGRGQKMSEPGPKRTKHPLFHPSIQRVKASEKDTERPCDSLVQI
jgi:hypothetical protein